MLTYKSQLILGAIIRISKTSELSPFVKSFHMCEIKIMVALCGRCMPLEKRFF